MNKKDKKDKKEHKPGLWAKYNNAVFKATGEKKKADLSLMSDYEKAEVLLSDGLMCQITLPELEVRSRGTGTRVGATVVLGIVGLALTSRTKTQNRKIKNIIRMAEKGIVISQGMSDGSDLKLPWEDILNVKGASSMFVINLVNGIEISAIPYGVMAQTLPTFGGGKYVAEVLNPRCKGVSNVEEGWD
jgi:hypothetical protein